MPLEPVVRTLTVTDEVTGIEDELPFHVAVIVGEPEGNWLPVSVMVAVAMPAEPTRVAGPSVVVPAVKTTEPTGVASPAYAVAEAVRVRLSWRPTLLRLPISDKLAVGGVTIAQVPVQQVRSFHASSDPSPVTGSYPTPAL